MNRLVAPLPRRFILLSGLWLIAQMATDVIRGTPFQDFARGWAKIAFFIAAFVVLYALLDGSRRRVVLYAVGLALGGVLVYYFNPGPYAADEPWKFGVGGPITLALVLVATNRWTHALWPLSVATVAFAALLNLYMGFRAFGGVCFMTALYLLSGRVFGRGRSAQTRRGIVPLALAGLCAGFALVRAYEYAAEAGVLGQEARVKYEAQAAGKLGVLVGGRNEIPISLRAIGDSPVIGHGSWAKSQEYAWLSVQLAYSLGYRWATDLETDRIPTHSRLLGSWVEAGIGGAIFWGWILVLSIAALAALRGTRDSLAPLIMFVGFMSFWDTLFSPFGAEQRIIAAYQIVLLLQVLERAPGRHASA